MPFKSKSQARFMYSQKPKMAKEWSAETPSIKALPEKAHTFSKVKDYMTKKRRKK